MIGVELKYIKTKDESELSRDATETIDELKKRGVKMDRVVVLTTQDPKIEISYYALALDFRWSYRGVKLERIELPFNDIKSQEDHDGFVRISKDVIKREMNSGRM